MDRRIKPIICEVCHHKVKWIHGRKVPICGCSKCPVDVIHAPPPVERYDFEERI